jgi:hypothetical protein
MAVGAPKLEMNEQEPVSDLLDNGWLKLAVIKPKHKHGDDER